jgi:hypothetical protein
MKCRIKLRRRKPNGGLIWDVYRPDGRKFMGGFERLGSAVQAARQWYVNVNGNPRNSSHPE